LDPSLVTVERSDSLLLETPHQMLVLNQQLLNPFLKPYNQPNGNNSESDKGKSDTKERS